MTTWPTGNFVTTNLDQGTDHPAQARADLQQALVELLAVIHMLAQPGGPASLGSDGKVPQGQLPVIPITKGGTGATTAAAARNALGIPAYFGQTTVAIDMLFPGVGETITGTNKARAIRISHVFIATRMFAAEVEGVESVDLYAPSPTIICISSAQPNADGSPVAGTFVTLSLAPGQGQNAILGQALDCSGGYVFAWILDASGNHSGIKLRLWFQSL